MFAPIPSISWEARISISHNLHSDRAYDKECCQCTVCRFSVFSITLRDISSSPRFSKVHVFFGEQDVRNTFLMSYVHWAIQLTKNMWWSPSSTSVPYFSATLGWLVVSPHNRSSSSLVTRIKTFATVTWNWNYMFVTSWLLCSLRLALQVWGALKIGELFPDDEALPWRKKRSLLYMSCEPCWQSEKQAILCDCQLGQIHKMH